MDMINIIQKKKRKCELSKEEINYFIQEYTKGSVPDYQMSALLMAICINGMNERETFDLTMAMVNSGDIMDLSKINGITVDKHSTGGVGDKTTLIISPIVAALGGHVAKMSGKGLGYTGGTIDKLESIEGFKTVLTEEEFFNQVNKIGVAVISQTVNLAPADKKIYALRDVTATVESVPLIASSVMSKKIAAGSDGIILDVKVGSGAFMKDIESATELANEMIKIGKSANRKVIALITNMDIPLGNNIGNALEIKEVIEVLKGEGPEDLKELCIELASYMLMVCNDKDINTIRKEVEECIKSGKALEKFKQMVKSQGGNEKHIENSDLIIRAKYEKQVQSCKSGYIIHMDTEKIGLISSMIGAGRRTKEDILDYTAGIILNKKVGNYVKEGELLATLYSSKIENMDEAVKEFYEAIEIVSEDEYNLNYKNKIEEKTKLIYKVIGE